MNRIFYLLIAGAVFFCSSCEKFLDKAALDKITNDNYYQDASQLNAAVNGIYNRVLISGYGQNGPAGQAQTLNGHFTYSDEAIQLNAALNVNNYASYIFDNSNVAVENLWQGMYQAIYHANSLIANVDKNPAIDASARSYALGQALFLRGYAFYVLASHFGGVPLRVETNMISTSNLPLARASLADTYGQAVSDIRLSIPMLKTAGATNTPSLVSRTAAQGVLARVFLTMAGPGTGDPATTISLNDPRYYDSTIYYAQQVVNSNEHSLYTAKQGMTFPDSSFAYIFINESRQITNIKECIWEATFSGNDVASQYPVTLQGATGIFAGPPCNATSPTDYGIIGTCFNAVNVPKGVYDLFGNGDLRRDWTICPYYYTTVKAGVTPTQPSDYNRSNYPTQPHEYYVRPQGKWRREFETIVPKSRFSSPESFPILRFSDVLLMLAEAELMSPTGNRSDALEKVNMVRRRGYGFPVNTGNALSDLTALTLNDIVDERTRELAFEGHRWVDLRRWGIYDTKMRALQARMEADGVNTANGSHGNGNQFYGGMTNRTMNFRSGYQYIVNANSSDKFALLPIPLTETSTNQLIVQNPGW